MQVFFDARALEAAYQQVNVPQVAATNMMSMQAAASMYLRALRNCIRRNKAYRVTAATERRRTLVKTRLVTHLANVPYQRTLLTCTPSDLLVYLDEVYVKQYKGAHTAAGELVAAPSSVEQFVSHLAQVFEDIGRVGPWQPASMIGNPAKSREVQNFKVSYRSEVTSAGVREVSAVPLKPGEEEETLTHLVGAMAVETRPMHRAAMARDGAMRSLLWQTKMRGAEVGSLRISSLQLLDGQPAGSRLFPGHTFQPGEVLLVRPERTKTEVGSRVQARKVSALVDPVLSPTMWLHRLFVTAAAAGAPVQGYLFRPMTPNQQGFKEAPYSRGSCWEANA